MILTTLQEAADYFDEMLDKHPERNLQDAVGKALKGEKREHPCIMMQQNAMEVVTDADVPNEMPIPSIDIKDSLEMEMAQALIKNIQPLRVLNPIPGIVRLGVDRFIVTSFGVPYEINPGATDYHKSADQVLEEGMPSLTESGLLPVTRQKIELLKATGSKIKIALPDTQGPFNLAHALVGSEIMYLPYEDEEKYTEFMNLMVRFWLGARQTMKDWIGEEYKSVTDIPTRIAECDVNMVSADFYKEFILPFDMQISKTAEGLHIHPCSGPHVFKVTLDNLPNVKWTEAGKMIETRTTAGSISVDDALEQIGDRKMAVSIGQELPFGQEYEFIKKDLDRYKNNYGLLFGYSGVQWSTKDRPKIREIHTRLDEYWAKEVWKAS